MKLQKVILRNVSIVSISTVATSIIGFAMVPYLVNHLGSLQYASYMIFNLFLVAGYAGLLYFGMPITITKLVAEYFNKNSAIFTSFYSTILIFTVFYGIFISIISLILYPSILDLINPKVSSLSVNQDYILLVIFTSYPIFYLQVFLDSTLEGLQKYSFLKSYKILLTLSNSFGIILLLENEYTVLEIYLLQAFLTSASNIFLLRYLNKIGVKFSIGRIDKSIFKPTFKFASTNFFSQISSTLFHESDRLLLAVWLPTIYFTYYDIATKIPRALKLVIGFTNIILPLSSQLNSKSDSKKLNVLFCSGSKLTYFIVFPFFGAAIYSSTDILNLWVGKEFTFLSGPFNDMVIWSLLSILISMGTNTLLGSENYMKPIMYYSWLVTISKLIISITLFNYYELRALTYAYLYSNLVTLPILFFLLKDFLKIDIKFFLSYLKIPIIFFITYIICNYLHTYINTISLTNFVIKSLFFIIISYFLMFYFFLNTWEKNFLRSIYTK